MWHPEQLVVVDCPFRFGEVQSSRTKKKTAKLPRSHLVLLADLLGRVIQEIIDNGIIFQEDGMVQGYGANISISSDGKPSGLHAPSPYISGYVDWPEENCSSRCTAFKESECVDLEDFSTIDSKVMIAIQNSAGYMPAHKLDSHPWPSNEENPFNEFATGCSGVVFHHYAQYEHFAIREMGPSQRRLISAEEQHKINPASGPFCKPNEINNFLSKWLISYDFAMLGYVSDLELMVSSLKQLPLDKHRLGALAYMWGIFCDMKARKSRVHLADRAGTAIKNNKCSQSNISFEDGNGEFDVKVDLIRKMKYGRIDKCKRGLSTLSCSSRAISEDGIYVKSSCAKFPLKKVSHRDELDVGSGCSGTAGSIPGIPSAGRSLNGNIASISTDDTTCSAIAGARTCSALEISEPKSYVKNSCVNFSSEEVCSRARLNVSYGCSENPELQSICHQQSTTQPRDTLTVAALEILNNMMLKGTTIIAIQLAIRWYLLGDTRLTSLEGTVLKDESLKILKASRSFATMMAGQLAISEILNWEVRSYLSRFNGEEDYYAYQNIINRTKDGIISKMHIMIDNWLGKLYEGKSVYGGLVIVDSNKKDCLVITIGKRSDRSTYFINADSQSRAYFGKSDIKDKIESIYDHLSDTSSPEEIKDALLLAMETAAKEDKGTGGMLTMFSGGVDIDWECLYAKDFQGLVMDIEGHKPVVASKRNLLTELFNKANRVSTTASYFPKVVSGVYVFLPMAVGYPSADQMVALFKDGLYGSTSKYPMLKGSNLSCRKQDPAVAGAIPVYDIFVLEKFKIQVRTPVCCVSLMVDESTTVGEIRDMVETELEKKNIVLDNISGRNLCLEADKKNLESPTVLYDLGVHSCPNKEELLWVSKPEIRIDRLQQTQKDYTFILS